VIPYDHASVVAVLTARHPEPDDLRLATNVDSTCVSRAESAICFAARRSGIPSALTLRSGRVGAGGCGGGEGVSRASAGVAARDRGCCQFRRIFRRNRQMRHRLHRLAAGAFECRLDGCEIGWFGRPLGGHFEGQFEGQNGASECLPEPVPAGVS